MGETDVALIQKPRRPRCQRRIGRLYLCSRGFVAVSRQDAIAKLAYLQRLRLRVVIGFGNHDTFVGGMLPGFRFVLGARK